MIIYDLICNAGHRFEGWFGNSTEFDQQLGVGAISCPICASAEVRKALSAARVMIGVAEPMPRTRGGMKQPSKESLQRLQEHIRFCYEDVGRRFPEEARKIHYGESQERRIRGIATPTEARQLLEEGIAVLPVASDTGKSKLN